MTFFTPGNIYELKSMIHQFVCANGAVHVLSYEKNGVLGYMVTNNPEISKEWGGVRPGDLIFVYKTHFGGIRIYKNGVKLR